MSVKAFYKSHIDTIEKSLLSLDFDEVDLFVDIISFTSSQLKPNWAVFSLWISRVKN